MASTILHAPRRESSVTAVYRREARERGIPWQLVREAARDVRAEARERLELFHQTRRLAWSAHVRGRRTMRPFWRHGFLSWYGRRIERGSDYTIIPRYDTTFQEVAGILPYWREAGIEAFWELLLSPYQRLPTAAEVYPEALNRAAAWAESEAATVAASSDEPFI